MPTKEELERLPLMWLAGVCKKISDADDASLPAAARDEAQTLWDEWLAIQAENAERISAATTGIDDIYKAREAYRKARSGAATTQTDNNYKTREADLKERTIAFLWRMDKVFPSLSGSETFFPKSW
jgi:hypothetical protein